MNILPRAFSLLASLSAGSLTLLHAAEPSLIWHDEFNLPANSPPESSKWNYDLGAGGWGNNELETYTDSTENAVIIDDSDALDGKALIIHARKSSEGGYTSARLKTQDKFTTVYGRIEARLKMPNGQGIWPAFWMLGANITTVDWPTCGEIDVVEVINANPKKFYGTLHGPGYSGPQGLQGSVTIPTGTLDQAYHIYAVDWSPAKIVWSFDGVPYQTQTPSTIPSGTRWVFNDAPFFLILNLAVGGGWPGNPNPSTVFPQTFSVDYVRVYRLAPSPAEPAHPRPSSKK